MIFATANKHKLREMRELLPELDLIALPEGFELPPEDGESFAAIALDKARAAHAASGEAAIGDDSGIEASGLSGQPGIRSARYGGPNASDAENLAKLLREVSKAGEDRRAAYHCALALVETDGAERVFEARCEGYLIERPRGEGGFGYDPAFVPDDTGTDDERTMSELSQTEKNGISHRGRAAKLLAAHLSADEATSRTR
ncbi:MAG: XTP/dITP diphosphohydrolase [Solirubrobacterales bacterium]|nr:XTP/dITP diphosphohydrolase [Solirubrobacterales bacterium]